MGDKAKKGQGGALGLDRRPSLSSVSNLPREEKRKERGRRGKKRKRGGG